MTFTVHDWHNGPYPARVRIALAEKGLQAQTVFVSVDLRKGAHKSISRPGGITRSGVML